MRKTKILLVDDEAVVLASLKKNLSQEDYDVTIVECGEEAVDLLLNRQFDIVVTDLSMPGLNGIQVLRKVKESNSMTSVIILTGYGNLDSSIEALRLGADDYLLKPCNFDELLIRIRRCLKKQETLKKVKIYENILPICMYCKSIRDDSGSEPSKGKWMPVESYIYHKSGNDISHGCCPKCYELHKDD